MILNMLSAHSLLPEVRDEVAPTEQLRLFPFSNPPFDAPPPGPMPPGPIRSSHQDYRAGCWLMQHAPPQREQALVLEDWKPLYSWVHFTPCQVCHEYTSKVQILWL